MADKIHMSVSGLSKIERGETKLNLHKLEQITNIFNIDIFELIDTGSKGVYFVMNENGDYESANYYGCDDKMMIEIERLKRMLAHAQEAVKQKEDEIFTLKEIISLLRAK